MNLRFQPIMLYMVWQRWAIQQWIQNKPNKIGKVHFCRVGNNLQSKKGRETSYYDKYKVNKNGRE